jgi:hypothetical protein
MIISLQLNMSTVHIRACTCQTDILRAACRDIPPQCQTKNCTNEAMSKPSWSLSPYATTEEKYHTLCHYCRETDRIAKLKQRPFSFEMDDMEDIKE